MIPLRTWGKHLMIDAAGAAAHTIRNPSTIHDFNKALVKRIDMVAYGTPQIVRFGSGNKAGYTLVQLIETSNICAHFVEENNSMYLDVFSCKDFDPATVKDTVEEYFQVKRLKMNVLTRQAPVDIQPRCLWNLA
jgi:S-adenosylmethionine/arginine decarboxylase-like enzyme